MRFGYLGRLQMTQAKKLPYYQIERSVLPFKGVQWKGYSGTKGCVVVETQKTVSMERRAPGEPLPPPPKAAPKPTPEQVKAQQAEEAHQKLLAKQQAKKSQQTAQANEQEKPVETSAEACENPPVFDLLDIPDAMEKMGWPVSARLARRWFSSPRNIYDDNPNSVQPIDDSSVSLGWVLKFEKAQEKYDELLSRTIYSDVTRSVLKKKLKPVLEQKFQQTVELSFDTSAYLRDLRQFHMDWQFQLAKVSNYDTLDGVAMTDLTGALANFGIYVAIGRAVVTGERFFRYNEAQGTKTYCTDPKIQITHVYVYVKDNYSFNDSKSNGKTQYLGHWNKKGMIVSTGGVISELLDGKHLHTDLGNSPKLESRINWEYLMSNPIDKPVDARRGMVRKFREEDVYFPVYNQTYNDWRTRHKRGGDFMIYTKPEYLKLKKPIEFPMETLCRQPEKM